MTLRLAPMESACRALPSTWMVVQWRGLHVWKVGPKDDGRSKVFAILSPEGHRGDESDGTPSATATLKVRPEREPFLRELEGVGTTPHLKRGGWLLFGPDCPLGDDDLAAYIAESHEIVGAGLPKAIRPTAGTRSPGRS